MPYSVLPTYVYKNWKLDPDHSGQQEDTRIPELVQSWGLPKSKVWMFLAANSD